MSFLKYLFDNDYAQRRDIEELREVQYDLLLNTRGGGASEKWVGEIAEEVKELAVLVRVLVRKLKDANLLDVEALREEVAAELTPKRKRAPAGAPRHEAPEAPAVEVSCMKCKTVGWSNEMVKVGSDWMCRPCARNP